jgi:UPF0755 protein
MIDELELSFDENAERGRHRRRRGGRKPAGKAAGKPGGKGGSGRNLIALALVLLLLGGLAGGAWYGVDKVRGFFSAADYATGGTGEVTVEIKPDQTLTEVANTLVRADVVKSAAAFVDAANANPRSTNIQPGVYKLRKQMRASDAVVLLLDLKNRIVKGVTIREGLTAKQTFRLLAEKTGIPLAQFEAAAKDPIALGVPDFWFTRSDKRRVTTSIEGFLFPQTYEFPPNATATQVLQTMVRQFIAVAQEIDFVATVQRERGGITPYEALIVASLAQVEAGNPADLGKVARVAYNRLYGDFPCNCLEMDVTVNYWLEVNGKPTKASKDMTDAELDDPKNPYNRKVKGLIPTPIDNPGKAALQGAADPPGGNWLYFVAIDKQGRSAFTNDYDQHLRNQEKARENGVL